MRRQSKVGSVTIAGPRTAVIYARVSKQGAGGRLQHTRQRELLRKYAIDRGLEVSQEFVDVESAKTIGRPGFAAMVEYLKRRPGRNVVLTEKTDRLYRNLKDYVTMDDLGVEIHMVKENDVLTKTSRSAERFMHGIRVLMAKNYIDNLSEEVKKGLHTKASQKLWPSFAPPGYRNAVSEDGKRIIVPDPVLGPIVTRLFTWFATGQYSLKSLAKKTYEQGFRFRKSGNRIPISTLHKILRKRICTGDFDYAGIIPGQPRTAGESRDLVPYAGDFEWARGEECWETGTKVCIFGNDHVRTLWVFHGRGNKEGSLRVLPLHWLSGEVRRVLHTAGGPRTPNRRSSASAHDSTGNSGLFEQRRHAVRKGSASGFCASGAPPPGGVGTGAAPIEPTL
jgi:DNA invertase Pin-like site-specific DNA recombinase